MTSQLARLGLWVSLWALMLISITFGLKPNTLNAQALQTQPTQAQASDSAVACAEDAIAEITHGVIVRYIESNKITRKYVVYVPERYDPTQPTPMVMSLHGFAGYAEQQMDWTGWNAIADRDGILAVYPDGLGIPKRWNSGLGFGRTAENDLNLDTAFIADLIADMAAVYCVDLTRVYINGLSNGGGMSHRVACELSDQIAAMGGVAGAYSPLANGCEPTRPMPVIAFHGTGDRIVAYTGDNLLQLLPIESWAAEWAARNGCAETPTPIEDTQGDVTGVRYGACDDEVEVILYTIADGGHTWPGHPPPFNIDLGKTTLDIDATETMWTFFQQYTLKSD